MQQAVRSDVTWQLIHALGNVTVSSEQWKQLAVLLGDFLPLSSLCSPSSLQTLHRPFLQHVYSKTISATLVSFSMWSTCTPIHTRMHAFTLLTFFSLVKAVEIKACRLRDGFHIKWSFLSLKELLDIWMLCSLYCTLPHFPLNVFTCYIYIYSCLVLNLYDWKILFYFISLPCLTINRNIIFLHFFRGEGSSTLIAKRMALLYCQCNISC